MHILCVRMRVWVCTYLCGCRDIQKQTQRKLFGRHFGLDILERMLFSTHRTTLGDHLPQVTSYTFLIRSQKQSFGVKLINFPRWGLGQLQQQNLLKQNLLEFCTCGICAGPPYEGAMKKEAPFAQLFGSFEQFESATFSVCIMCYWNSGENWPTALALRCSLPDSSSSLCDVLLPINPIISTEISSHYSTSHMTRHDIGFWYHLKSSGLQSRYRQNWSERKARRARHRQSWSERIARRAARLCVYWAATLFFECEMR